jgi:pimeloyl-ACP methyl ester carboxylesterase
LKELAVKQMAETRQAVLYGDFLACDAFDVVDHLKKICVPTLLICGSEDRMMPPNRSEYLRDEIEGAQLHVLEGAGHMVMIERPEEVASLLTDFLEQIPY